MNVKAHTVGAPSKETGVSGKLKPGLEGPKWTTQNNIVGMRPSLQLEDEFGSSNKKLDLWVHEGAE